MLAIPAAPARVLKLLYRSRLGMATAELVKALRRKVTWFRSSVAVSVA